MGPEVYPMRYVILKPKCSVFKNGLIARCIWLLFLCMLDCTLNAPLTSESLRVSSPTYILKKG